MKHIALHGVYTTLRVHLLLKSFVLTSWIILNKRSILLLALVALMEITYIFGFFGQIMWIKSVLISTTLVLMIRKRTISSWIAISLHHSPFISANLMWFYSFIIWYYTLFKLPLFNWIIYLCCLMVVWWLLGLKVLRLKRVRDCFLGWYLYLFIGISHLYLVLFQFLHVCYLILLHLLQLIWYWDWKSLLLTLICWLVWLVYCLFGCI